MTNALQRVFEYEGRQVRTVMIDGEPWFVARDVCEVFGDTHYRRSVGRLDEDEKGVTPLSTPGGTQPITVVNEPGLYTLLFNMQPQKRKSMTDEEYQDRVDGLRRFRRWVTHEVLPSIRQTGSYSLHPVPDMNTSEGRLQILHMAIEAEQRAIAAERTNAILMHVNKTYTATEIAKELGFRSAIALNKDLAERRIQFRQNNTWVLYSDYAARGYTDIKQEVLDNGRVIYHRRWTQLGREFLLDLYNREAKSA